jgi:hypothetical protein
MVLVFTSVVLTLWPSTDHSKRVEMVHIYADKWYTGLVSI